MRRQRSLCGRIESGNKGWVTIRNQIQESDGRGNEYEKIVEQVMLLRSKPGAQNKGNSSDASASRPTDTMALQVIADVSTYWETKIAKGHRKEKLWYRLEIQRAKSVTR